MCVLLASFLFEHIAGAVAPDILLGYVCLQLHEYILPILDLVAFSSCVIVPLTMAMTFSSVIGVYGSLESFCCCRYLH